MGGNLVSTKSDVKPEPFGERGPSAARPECTGRHRTAADVPARCRATTGRGPGAGRIGHIGAVPSRIIRARSTEIVIRHPRRTPAHSGVIRAMTVDQDILLPLLLAAIIANTVIMAAVVIAGRPAVASSRDRPARACPPPTRRWPLRTSSAPPACPRRRSRGGRGDRRGAAVRDADAVDAIDPPNEPPPVIEPVTPAPPTEEPVVDAATEPLSTDGIDPDTGLLDGAAFHRLVVQEDGRLRRYHRPGDGRHLRARRPRSPGRTPRRSGRRARRRRPWPTRSVASLAAPTTPRALVAAGSRSSCPRPTRSPRSTTSSGSGAPPSCGSSRAPSPSASRSAGPARPATRHSPTRSRSRSSGCTPSFDAVRAARTPHALRPGPGRSRDSGHGTARSFRRRAAGLAPPPRTRTACLLTGLGAAHGARVGQSIPRRIPRPGVAPVCSPASTTSVPLTTTCSMPVGKRRGSS